MNILFFYFKHSTAFRKVHVHTRMSLSGAADQWHKQLSMPNNQYWANSTLPKDTGIAVGAVMSAGKVISQLLSRGSFDSVPVPSRYLPWPCSDKVASLAAQWDTALLQSSIIKYISVLHLSGTTLWLVRRIYQWDTNFSASRALPPPLEQTQLFLNEVNIVQIMSHLVKHL